MDAAKFTMSSRPMTAHRNTSPEVNIMYNQTQEVNNRPGEFNISEIVYYTSDWLITNISDNNKIQKLPPLKYDQKSLQLPAHSSKFIVVLRIAM